MNDTQIRNKIDSFMTPQRLAQFTTLENNFKTANGKYFQGVLTPPALPVDGADVDIVYEVHPTDQLQDWEAFLGNRNYGKIPCSIAIHYNSGPLGDGFTIVVEYANAQGQKSWRMFGTGQYSSTTNWAVMVNGSVG